MQRIELQQQHWITSIDGLSDLGSDSESDDSPIFRPSGSSQSPTLPTFSITVTCIGGASTNIDTCTRFMSIKDLRERVEHWLESPTQLQAGNPLDETPTDRKGKLVLCHGDKRLLSNQLLFEAGLQEGSTVTAVHLAKKVRSPAVYDDDGDSLPEMVSSSSSSWSA